MVGRIDHDRPGKHAKPGVDPGQDNSLTLPDAREGDRFVHLVEEHPAGGNGGQLYLDINGTRRLRERQIQLRRDGQPKEAIMPSAIGQLINPYRRIVCARRLDWAVVAT